MANGDAAATAGMDVVAATDDKRNGYDEINKTRDYIAAGDAAAIASSRLPVVPISKGGTGATTAVAARTAFGAAATAHTHVWADITGEPATYPPSAHNHNASDITSGTITRPVDAGSGPISGGEFHAVGSIFTPAGRSTPVTSNYVGAWLNGDGRLGASASSRRFKQDIVDWSPDLQAVLALRLVQFRYIEQVEAHGDDAPIDYGVIAEELVDLGLTPWVFYDSEGRPQGVHYERLCLALLPVLQDHEARLAELEAR